MNQLPFPKKINQTIDHKLESDLVLRQWQVSSGTTVKLCQTATFGIVVIPNNTIDKRTGTIIPRRVFSV